MKLYVMLSMMLVTMTSAMEPTKLSLIEFFSGITKENYNILPKELQKTMVIDVLMPALINKPWHYVEHKIEQYPQVSSFNPDNQLVLVTRDKVNWFDCQSGCTVKSINYERYDDFSRVCLDKKGERLVVVGRNASYIADLSLKKPAVIIDNKFLSYGGIDMVCVNHDDSRVVVAMDTSHMHFYDIKTGQYDKFGMYGHNGSLNNLCFSHLESMCALVNDKNEIIIGDDVSKGQVIIQKYYVIPHEKRVASLCFNHDASQLGVGFCDGMVSVFDVATGLHVWSLFITNMSQLLCFDSMSKRIAIGSFYTNNATYVINQYDDYTFEQVLLRKLMYIWLKRYTPESNISSMEKIFKKIAVLFNLDKKELQFVWNSFSVFM